jgi:hypothetical protein
MSKDLGDKLGPRLAALIGKYTTAARNDHAPIEARIRQVATQKLIDKAGMEVAEHIRPLLVQAIDDNPDMHPAVKDYLLRTASGKHQLQAIAGHLALGSASGVISTLLNNELADFVYGAVRLNPHLRLDQNTAATAAAQGIIDDESMNNEGNSYGYDSNRMNFLKAMAMATPDAVTLGEMVNRGLISEADARFWIQRGGYGQSLHDPLLALRFEELSPADAALAVLRGALTHDQGIAKAELSGVRPDDFQTLIDNTGEPLALESLLEARRRGFIDDQRLIRGILQSRVRDEWIDVALKLEHEPMSTADAVNAVVQGYFTDAEAQQIAEWNGLEPGQVDTLIKTAGEPLSRTEMESLYNRGEVTQADVEQALRESRLKDKYVPDAVKLHVRLPEGRQVVSMITHSAISKEAGTRILLELGYQPDIAAALIAEGTNTKLGAHKEFTLAQLGTLFKDGIFTEPETVTHLGTLGYDAAESAVIIKLWTLEAGAAITKQAIGAIRGRYVAHDLTEQQVTGDLESLGIPSTARDQYLRVWNIERAARLAELTEAQIVKAHKDGLISGQDAYDRLTGKGYSPGDARILLGVDPGGPIPA